MKYSLKSILGILFLSGVAAIGTIPYGFKFSYLFFSKNSHSQIILGLCFASTAALANTALGTYSLLSIESYKNLKKYSSISSLSLLAAIPYGFICYFGYQAILPQQINLPMSLIVMIVNAGIGFTAIKAVITSLPSLKKVTSFFQKEVALRGMGVLIGIIISLFAYLAAANGFINIFRYYAWKDPMAKEIAYTVSLLPWIPMAALFANANQTAIKEIYLLFSLPLRSTKKYFIRSFLLLAFAAASGSALAQMSFEFFSASLPIPALFKLSFLQSLIYPLIIPMTFFSSVAVNYFSIKNVIHILTHKNKYS